MPDPSQAIMMKNWIKTLAAIYLILFTQTAIAQTYRIGLLVPLTGARADKGIPLKNAAELFVAQFNAANRDTQLELVIRDDHHNPEKAVAAARELVKDPALLAVIGHYYTDIALATAKVFSDAHIPFISPNVSNRQLTDSNPWMFMMNLSDDLQGSFMAVYIKEVLKKDQVLLLHNDGAFGWALRDAFVKKAARIGLNIAKVLQVPRAHALPADWIKTHLPDGGAQFGIVAALTHAESGLDILPQLREHGIDVPVMGNTTWTDDRFITQLPEKHTKNVYVSSSFLWEVANQRAAKFARNYRTQFNSKPTIPAAMTFDAAFLLGHIIQSSLAKNQSPTRTNVRDALASVGWHDSIEGVTGILFFNNQKDKTQEYIEQYFATTSGVAVSSAATPDARHENRALLRDVFVSEIKDGRFKVAAVQLIVPREEYVLKQLKERMAKGYLIIADNLPYHIVDVVFVGVDVVRISDVNIKDMQWEVDVFMWFKWSGEHLDIKEIEKIGVINAMKEQSTLLKENLSRSIQYRAYRKHLTLEAPYDLSAFPFDSQRLPLSIAHTNKNATHIMLVVDSRHIETSPIQDIKPREWNYVERQMFSDLYRYESTFGDPDYRMGTGYKSPIYFSSVNLEIGIKRILKPYLYTFFLPLVILLGIILLILWVPLDQFTPRINASVSGLVGILVYHMSQKSAFPKVGYTMVADYYFLMAYAFVVAMIICIIYTQTLMSKGQKEQAKRWNHRFSIGAMILSLGMFGLLTLYAAYFAEITQFTR